MDVFEGKSSALKKAWNDIKTGGWGGSQRGPIGRSAKRGPLDPPKRCLGHCGRKVCTAFSLLWFKRPDNSQHRTGPGANRSLKSIKSSDDKPCPCAGGPGPEKAYAGSNRCHRRSDHGFSSISHKVNVEALLNQNGFPAVSQIRGPMRLKLGNWLLVGNGGLRLFVCPNHDQVVTEKVVHWLQSQLFAGSDPDAAKPVEGAFPLESAKINFNRRAGYWLFPSLDRDRI